MGPTGLLNHQETTHKNYRYQCPICPYIGTNRGNTQKHLVNLHKLSTEESKKEIIIRTGSEVEILNNYSQIKVKIEDSDSESDVGIETSGIIFECGIYLSKNGSTLCNFTTHKKQKLVKHQNIVHPTHRFECPICGRRFSAKHGAK
jgi:hypothetical protein